MTDKTSPRLRRTLGLGAAIGLAAGPAAALTPTAPDAGPGGHAVAGAAQEVLTALADTDAAFPGLAPEGGLPADGSQILAGAAARVELAGLALQ